MNKLKKFTISQLNKTIYDIIELNLYILFEIEGEVTNLNIIEGNVYFTLKEGNNKINAIIWSNIFHDNKGISNGDKISCEALLKSYQKNSSFRLIVKKYRILGKGIDNEKFICLKKKTKRNRIFR